LISARPARGGQLPGARGVSAGVVRTDRRAWTGSEEDRAIVQIFVRDNNVDQALKALKKKMQREGSFREMKRHVHYEKPSEKRARQRAEAIRRARKLARKRAQREGLIAAPPRVAKGR
jgi:small subunit ribosomal protein S21